MPNNKKISNIQEHHSLGEYQRYFSHLLRDGKLKRYPINQKNKLDPNRQYWKIKDEKGRTFYYEVPKYIKPESTKSAYSLSRVMHRRPARAALAIFAVTAIFSITSAVVTKKVFVPHHFPDIPPQPEPEPEEMFKALHDFQEWHKENPKGDATKQYTLGELANIAMTATLYDANQYEEGAYPRRPLLAVGFGSTLSIGIVKVSVTNAFIFDTQVALEESISFSDSWLPQVPKVGRRDFYFEDKKKVESNPGTASSDIKITWKDTVDRNFTYDEYVNQVGKIPDNPFLYSINENTILEGSGASKTSSGYQIDFKLDTVNSVVRYVKRMKYLSGKTATKFYGIKLSFTTDNNLRLISTHVDETYVVDGTFDTDGNLTTTFYYDDVPPVPNRKDSFDYSKYKA